MFRLSTGREGGGVRAVSVPESNGKKTWSISKERFFKKIGVYTTFSAPRRVRGPLVFTRISAGLCFFCVYVRLSVPLSNERGQRRYGRFGARLFTRRVIEPRLNRRFHAGCCYDTSRTVFVARVFFFTIFGYFFVSDTANTRRCHALRRRAFFIIIIFSCFITVSGRPWAGAAENDTRNEPSHKPQPSVVILLLLSLLFSTDTVPGLRHISGAQPNAREVRSRRRAARRKNRSRNKQYCICYCVRTPICAFTASVVIISLFSLAPPPRPGRFVFRLFSPLPSPAPPILPFRPLLRPPPYPGIHASVQTTLQ